ncbi:ReoY family proteolytic degradation factor [Terribacillus sp. 7520-G]|uniref:ReoY family proteolytic degradation factor n=1 Tax=Terribacillus TaxID=459532 RepID=UPI000BA6267F|nr:ReoY family proteolytic degradation factor [Terribacillus sp. 7520-G]PAD39343.1 hypothetical protein CHH53_06175 [Terribacillus sp. 7520-G]
MNISVTMQDKKTFIRWFLDNYQLKRRESVWILNYLINHDSFLDNVHFIREARFSPRGIIISAHCSDEVPFRFYKDNIVTTDAEKSFHDIRMNKKDPVYIQLNFKNSHQSMEYVAVLEDNPFLPEDHYVTKEDRQLAAKLLDASHYQYKKKKLQEAIDLALDKRDEDKFRLLSKAMRQLKEEAEDKIEHI